MCVCDDKNIGNEVILKSEETPCFPNMTIFLDLAIFRADRWNAEIQAWATNNGRKMQMIAVGKPINYCPMCGRRLSLGDAGRRENEGQAD